MKTFNNKLTRGTLAFLLTLGANYSLAHSTRDSNYYNKTAPTIKEADEKLFTAVKAGDLEKVLEAIFLLKANVNVRTNSGRTPLMQAGQFNHTMIAKVLIDYGAELTARNNFRRTALHYTAFDGSTETALLFIDEGANLYAKDEEGSTPFLLAVKNGHIELADLFIRKSVQINAGWVRVNNEWVKSTNVLPNNVMVHERDLSGKTPLIWAAINNDKEMAQWLIDKGANLTAYDDETLTALDYARRSEDEELVQIILSKYQKEINDKLLSAIRDRDLEGVVISLEKGADIDTKDDKGNTPLMLAIKLKEETFAQYLIAKGANIEAENDQGYTPLISATKAGLIDIVQILVDLRANTEAQDSLGRTPLILAIINGDSRSAKYLLEAEASIYTKDRNGKNAVDYAKEYNRESILNLYE